MNQKRAKEILPIIEAFVDGRTVQWFCEEKSRWEDAHDLEGITGDPFFVKYRIKPEQKVIYGFEHADPAFVSSIVFDNEEAATKMHAGDKGRVIKFVEEL